ncbi:hypothetical protein [Paenibacillus koleovorans]|uniref:hypothetical protein n=1 Tax=Paenibacillus koleovorans TaxID=121608 RepID=UPI000FD6F7A0|nr:hypothetical protein [Paenibacillus koleovorans]
MRLPYKIGYGLTIGWLGWLLYGLTYLDSVQDELLSSVWLVSAFAGLILFPVYFVMTAVVMGIRGKVARK